MKRKTKIEQAIERLKIEKVEVEKAYFDEGKEYGYTWCLEAHYREIQRMLSWDGESFSNDPIISAVIESIVEEDDFMEINKMSLSPLNVFADYYFSGFIEGVDEFWDEIRDKLK